MLQLQENATSPAEAADRMDLGGRGTERIAADALTYARAKVGSLFVQAHSMATASTAHSLSSSTSQEDDSLFDEYMRQSALLRGVDHAVLEGTRDETIDAVALTAGALVEASQHLDLDLLVNMGVSGLEPGAQTLLITAVGEAATKNPMLRIQAGPLLVRCLHRVDSPACRIGAVQAMERLGDPEFSTFLRAAADSEPLTYIANFQHTVAGLIGGSDH